MRYVNSSCKSAPFTKVNKQNFLQVFQGNGIGNMEDNLTSADPLSYATIGSRVDQGSWVSVSCVHNPTPDLKHWTDRQVRNSSSNNNIFRP